MSSRRAVATAFAITILLVAAVQLADPQFEERQPPEVDFSEPPSEVAADAAAQFEYIDYAYRIEIADNRSGEWRRYSSARVGHSNRVYRSMGPAGERGVLIYGTDAITFVRPGMNGSWRTTAYPGTLYPANQITQPFSTNQIRKSAATIRSENDTTMVVSVDANPAKTINEYSGNATIFIQKDSGFIEKAIITYETRPRGTRYLKFRAIEYDVQVERPGSIPVSPREIFWDILRGPIFGILVED